ncbi:MULTISPECIES: hypothetical protein [unclassified Bradyrhizobium]|uniref:hypothetical protein n=1 Tax=unclassified Bradyrhizobium TaxID=2631580 RepID=UPI0028EB715E|nr:MULTISPECIES: hypothetical protein [unclassified Bradyrhizobium]
MTTQTTPYPRVQYLIDTFAQWLKHRRELSEIRQMDREDFERIAADLQVSPADLDELVRHGEHAADELPQMLKALSIDEAALARSEPMVLRDMERVCALCKDKPRCHRDLATGTASAHYEEYCPNAPTIDRLGADLVKHA